MSLSKILPYYHLIIYRPQTGAYFLFNQEYLTRNGKEKEKDKRK
jgi:hypothetical protein